jgi:tRNA(adenine34) deaminase
MEAIFTDTYFMKEALKEAQKAFDAGEVPVGAVIVSNGKIIARAHNLTERLTDVTAHAEIMAITAAANHLGSKYLDECTLYVSLEPCLMCAGAIFHARLERLVWAAADEKRGFTLLQKPVLHPKTIVSSGLLADESRLILQAFFQGKR